MYPSDEEVPGLDQITGLAAGDLIVVSQISDTNRTAKTITRANLVADITPDITTGLVQSVSGLNTDNTDPVNPVVAISVDGITITGDGTPGNPLVSVGGGGGGTGDNVIISSVQGVLLPLTTLSGDIVTVWAKGDIATSNTDPTITLQYNSVTKDTAVTQNIGSEKIQFALEYTETPGAATNNITVVTTGGTLSNVVIIAQITRAGGSQSSTSGVFSRAIDTASNTQTIAHGLTSTPNKVKITANWNSAMQNNAQSFGVYQNTANTTATIWGHWYPGSGALADNSTTDIISIYDSNSSSSIDGQTATITVDSTNITLVWTKQGTPGTSDLIQILWEAEI